MHRAPPVRALLAGRCGSVSGAPGPPVDARAQRHPVEPVGPGQHLPDVPGRPRHRLLRRGRRGPVRTPMQGTPGAGTDSNAWGAGDGYGLQRRWRREPACPWGRLQTYRMGHEPMGADPAGTVSGQRQPIQPPYGGPARPLASGPTGSRPMRAGQPGADAQDGPMAGPGAQDDPIAGPGRQIMEVSIVRPRMQAQSERRRPPAQWTQAQLATGFRRVPAGWHRRTPRRCGLQAQSVPMEPCPIDAGCGSAPCPRNAAPLPWRCGPAPFPWNPVPHCDGAVTRSNAACRTQDGPAQQARHRGRPPPHECQWKAGKV